MIGSFLNFFLFYLLSKSLISIPQILVWFGLVWFSDISTIVGYLMLNPVFTLNIWFVNTFLDTHS